MRDILKKRAVAILAALVILGGVFAVVSLYNKDTAGLLGTQRVDSESLVTKQETIGTSVEGRKIEAYTYMQDGLQAGSAVKTHMVFVGGIHGGYEWNSVMLAYRFMDYIKENPEIIPENIIVTVIPSANPDGVYKVTGKDGRFVFGDIKSGKEELEDGRFNANGVDLNRNFDCKWKPESMWKGNVVSAGDGAFSEPEARALKNFVFGNNPDAFVFWHSQSNAVYASECERGILPGTLAIMEAYSRGSEYPAVESFDAYEITGDAEGWLASVNIPAITVELKTHETIEWSRNLAGIEALFKYYTQ